MLNKLSQFKWKVNQNNNKKKLQILKMNNNKIFKQN